MRGLSKSLNEVRGGVETADTDLDYAAEFIESIDIIPELQNVQGWLKNALINAGKIKDIQDKAKKK